VSKPMDEVSVRISYATYSGRRLTIVGSGNEGLTGRVAARKGSS
jgi:hypothetical protein